MKPHLGNLEDWSIMTHPGGGFVAFGIYKHPSSERVTLRVTSMIMGISLNDAGDDIEIETLNSRYTLPGPNNAMRHLRDNSEVALKVLQYMGGAKAFQVLDSKPNEN
jgi:hypothetical protein